MNKPFPLLLYPVGTYCNMRCSYCMRPELDREPTMSEDTLMRVIDQYGWASDINGYYWQGGEPTLAGLDFYQTAVKNQKPGSMNMMQTNGVLLDEEWIEFFKQWNWNVSVSYDGHIGERGKGAKKAFDAMELLAVGGVRFSVSCVVTKWMAENLDTDQILDDIAGRTNFVQFIAEKATDPSDRVANRITGPQFTQFLRRVVERKHEYPDLHVRNVEGAYGAWKGKPFLCETAPPMFPGGCGRYLVVDNRGDVWPCDHYHREKAWFLGNVHSTTLNEIFNSELLFSFAKQKGVPHPRCKICDVREACFHGCPADRRLVNGGPAELSPMCSAHKYLANITRPSIPRRQGADPVSRNS